ncbi:uncharacterized protein LOC134212006 [Armigeres subalbatus]|uniref:uncharacterized protein LOC134212006 n=1 Tax=Armigeres subalbatus TaxID=124917 RepID=UPI002ED00600
MPPKRRKSSQAVPNQNKKPRDGKNKHKMAANQLNVAELRALLQAALEEQGETVGTSGYAYVAIEDKTVDSLQMESQDPLSNTPQEKETKRDFRRIKCCPIV